MIRSFELRKSRRINLLRRFARATLRMSVAYYLLCSLSNPIVTKTKFQDKPRCHSVGKIAKLVARPGRSEVFNSNNPLCSGAAEHTFHILLPFHTKAPSAATESVAAQNYGKVQVSLLEDGSGHLTTTYWLRKCAGIVNDISNDFRWESRFDRQGGVPPVHTYTHCFRSTKQYGLAHTLYVGLEMIARQAGSNDIVFLLDGDDSIASRSSLQTVNDAYLRSHAWCSYGSHLGSFPTGTMPFNTPST